MAKSGKMGFELNRRPHREYNNQRVDATIGGKLCHFRSNFEHKWALYSQFRKEQGLIKDWAFEQTTFIFKDEIKGAKMYLIDFDILNNDGTFHYEECKGYLEPSTVTKLRRTKKYRPDVVIDLIMQGIPQKGNAGRRVERLQREGYIRRVIDANKIFRQLKGII